MAHISQEVVELACQHNNSGISSLCIRWVPVETGGHVLDPSVVELADALVRVGTVQFKGNAYMYILHASFLADVRKSLQSSILQLTNAKKSQPRCERGAAASNAFVRSSSISNSS